MDDVIDDIINMESGFNDEGMCCSETPLLMQRTVSNYISIILYIIYTIQYIIYAIYNIIYLLSFYLFLSHCVNLLLLIAQSPTYLRMDDPKI